MGISGMPAPKDSLLLYVVYNAVLSVAALAGALRAGLVFLGLPAPPALLLLSSSGDDGEDAVAAAVSSSSSSSAAAAGPTLAERFRASFRPARFGRRRGVAPDCRVCLVRFEPEVVVNRLPCGHLFHRACLETWLDYDHATCPLCRSRLLPAPAAAARPPSG
ncbi:hypothetical protein GUJ93_ZPchr0002g24609 [Zizania palustris]|uniref:RING-type domain-containing protein n=1 Tax=Zizania palustris TaxID=103762 RepID=A0A8J5RMX5_ZIZPA|nr:hypothetical protein GUJ93_ZPchr0002g24609 [Zizania palustris]